MLRRRVQPAIAITALLELATVQGGCANPLPSFPLLSPDASLQTIAQRLDAVHAISARCDVTLTDSHGTSVQFDGALVAERSMGASKHRRFRLRMWKFDQAVFDLAVIDDESWLQTPADRDLGEQLKAIGRAQAQQIADSIWLFGAGFFQHAATLESESSTDRLVVTSLAFDSPITCEIDRRTLTPRRFVLSERHDRARAEIRADQYRIVNSVPWPTRINFRGEPGEIDLRMTDIELNGPLADGAFKLPSRAVRLL